MEGWEYAGSLQPITTPADFINDHIFKSEKRELISEISRCNDRLEWKPAYTRPSMAKIGHPWFTATHDSSWKTTGTREEKIK